MFITIEGIEGSGKSTQVPKIKAIIEGQGHRCTLTREPGGTPAGAAIRAILLDPASGDLDAMAELLLYAADRAQHAARVIRPALEQGRTVLCDRYFDATLAYQGAARGLPQALIRQLHTLTTGDLQPDLTLLLDLPPETGLARAWQRIRAGDGAGPPESRFESEALEFHERVRQGYLDLARREPQRFRLVAADRDAGAVTDEIRRILDAAFETTGGRIP